MTLWKRSFRQKLLFTYELFYRYRRYLLFSVEYFVFERPRGLDFTMRDKSLLKSTGGELSGYAKINEKHFCRVIDKMAELSEGLEKERLLDIGCGKGAALKEALRYPFEKVAGIEIQENLVRTAQKNFRLLHIEDKVECICGDALTFGEYGKYTVFFLANPFGREILKQVMDRIIAQNKGQNKNIFLIYHSPVHKQVIEETGLFEKKFTMFDSLRQYDTYVYQGVL